MTVSGTDKHLDEALLQAFLLDPEFGESLPAEEEAHLETCQECQTRLAELILKFDLLNAGKDRPLSAFARSWVDRLGHLRRESE
jgi:hypothetical protein